MPLNRIFGVRAVRIGRAKRAKSISYPSLSMEYRVRIDRVSAGLVSFIRK